MKYIAVCIFLLLSLCLNAQSLQQCETSSTRDNKPCIDASLFGKWPSVTMPGISGDGKYYCYAIEHGGGKYHTLILSDTARKWQIRSSLSGWYQIAKDAQRIVWINANDSLCIAKFGSNVLRYIPGVSSFMLNGDFVICELKGAVQKLIIRNLNVNMSSNSFRKPRYTIGGGRGVIFLLDQKANLGHIVYEFDKGTEKLRVLWNGKGGSNLIRDEKNWKVAFLSDSSDNTLWYYEHRMPHAVPLKVPLDSNYKLSGSGYFSRDGKRVFLDVLRKADSTQCERISDVKIWSYLDSELLSRKLTTYGRGNFTISYCFINGRTLRVTCPNDWIFMPKFQDSVALVRHQMNISTGGEVNWNIKARYEWNLVFLESGRRVKLDRIHQNEVIGLSGSGKYVIYYDKKELNYFVYVVATGEYRNITKGIHEDWIKSIDKGSYGRSIAGWEVNDSFVFVYGRRDIWKIDPSGLLAPTNVTNGYGDKRNISFFLSLEEYAQRYILKGETLILSAFDHSTKDNGFYRKKLDVPGDPALLTMGPFIYDITDNPSIPQGANFSPIRAAHSGVYIVRRMNSAHAPNFFVTTDFIKLKPLSSISPESKYNWYISELHTWCSMGGRELQGILYKPENFDSTKRYPIILYYYERLSDGLNMYMEPKALDNGCAINIPYYVSNGYLVFCPDVFYTLGDPMEGTYDAVISATNHLIQLPYVNRGKIGIQGCSWGGIQTNFLVTHSRLFAAACSASGIADWVSSYNSINGSGESMQGMYEAGQLRMASTLWERRDIYIKNSAVYSADKVASPLLLMHTVDDEVCAFANILEFFTALRRLGKRSWLLAYPGNHTLSGQDAEDFSVRMMQFFDHYLRDKLTPRWMTRPLVQEMDEGDTSLEFDDGIRTPGTGLVNDPNVEGSL